MRKKREHERYRAARVERRECPREDVPRVGDAARALPPLRVVGRRQREDGAAPLRLLVLRVLQHWQLVQHPPAQHTTGRLGVFQWNTSPIVTIKQMQ